MVFKSIFETNVVDQFSRLYILALGTLPCGRIQRFFCANYGRHATKWFKANQSDGILNAGV